MGLRRSSSDRSSISPNDTTQLKADAKVLASSSNSEDRALGENKAWAVAENERNSQGSGR